VCGFADTYFSSLGVQGFAGASVIYGEHKKCKGEETQLCVQQINNRGLSGFGVHATRGSPPHTVVDAKENVLGAARPPAARCCFLPLSDRRARDQFTAGAEDQKS